MYLRISLFNGVEKSVLHGVIKKDPLCINNSLKVCLKLLFSNKSTVHNSFAFENKLYNTAYHKFQKSVFHFIYK
ncbi:hypothetical protein T02_14641 [Trichinella nativa]|uniref:Uncharacterized protein n=1 Tax=Trichinella nativa TaxID=6335 RepID=A0A0V1L9C0_9BILA|nr:hypothetical protein T02_14641 [Trichinella nativa]